MISKPDDLPSDLVSALAALQAEREARLRAEAMAASEFLKDSPLSEFCRALFNVNEFVYVD